MRILVGVTEIAGLLPTFADGFRKLGHTVTSVVWQRDDYYSVDYDVDLTKIQSYDRAISIIKDLIDNHDVFFFQWARQSLLTNNEDFPILKQLNKKIISLFVGSDVRFISAYKQWYREAQPYLDQLPFTSEPITNPLHALRMAEMFSDLIFSVPDQSVLAVRPYLHSLVPMDLSQYAYNIPARDIPVIVHAPSRKWLKGTDLIEQALDGLKAEGILFELQLLHEVHNDQVIEALSNADVVIDEMFFPLHGKLTLEAMASGCAVANGDNEEYAPFPPNRPIWNINPKNILNQLRRLLTDKELRIRLAVEGHDYVERYHNHVSVAQRIIDHLDENKLIKYDYLPTFYARDFHLSEGEVIPEELKIMTTDIINRWGLPEDINTHDMISRGLMSSRGLYPSNPIPRWKVI
jgi:hypothetical protein